MTPENDIFYNFSFLDKPCTSLEEENRMLDDQSDYTISELHAAESGSDEEKERLTVHLTELNAYNEVLQGRVFALERQCAFEQQEKNNALKLHQETAAELIALKKSYDEMKSASDLRQLEGIQKEKEREAVRLAELKASNEAHQSIVFDLERQCAFEQQEKNNALKLHQETAAELIALKKSYHDLKINADTFKEKSLCLNIVCDEFQEKKTNKAEKIKETPSFKQIVCDEFQANETELVNKIKETSFSKQVVNDKFQEKETQMIDNIKKIPFSKRTIKQVKPRKFSRREIQEMLAVFKRIGEEIEPLLEPLPTTFKPLNMNEKLPISTTYIEPLLEPLLSTFKPTNSDEEAPIAAKYIDPLIDPLPSYLTNIQLNVEKEAPVTTMYIEPLLEPLPRTFKAINVDVEPPIATKYIEPLTEPLPSTSKSLKPKEKIRRPKKCKSSSRAAAQPVTQKSLESKLSPESLLASLLDSKMDFESIIRRINDEELKSIRKLNAEEFGKIMADVAIHLQTGDMWISALNKYRTRHSNTITNRTEENFIEVSSKLCAENTNIWIPFMRRLWLWLVSQPNHNASFCCRLTRYICLAFSMEVQLQQYGNSVLYSNAAQFFRSLLISLAFQYPEYLDQIIIFTVNNTSREHMQFLNTEEGECIRKILITSTDINTRDMIIWYWQSSYDQVSIPLLKASDSVNNEFTAVNIQKFAKEPLEFTENGYLKMDKDLARCLRMRSLTVSTTNGQTSLLEDCKAVEVLLNTACRNYAPHAVEVDPVIGNLFSITTALGDMEIIEARILVIRLFSIIYLLPFIVKSPLVAVKATFIRKFEAVVDKCHIISEVLHDDNKISSETRVILHNAFSHFLKLAPTNLRLQ